MKATVVAFLLLLVLIGGVIFNAVYIENTTQRLYSLVVSLPDLPERHTAQQVEDILAFAQWHKPYWGITVHFSAIDHLMEVAQALLIYAKAGDVINYQVSKATLLHAIEDMGRLEKLWGEG